jgi:1-deoxy-D-xylulose-5-phosphate synthase
MAAGLAANGMKPVFAVYSTFLQRAYDQILHDVCMQNLPVVLAIDRGGIVGEDGETHQGVFDISYLRNIPNLVIMAPKSTEELRQMLRLSFELDCPVAVRYPKGSDPDGLTYEHSEEMVKYRSEVICSGKDTLIIAAGRTVPFAYRAVLELRKSGLQVGLINARFIKPLDKYTILKEAAKYKNILTVEDNVISGGFGSSITELLSENNITNKNVKLLGFPDEFIPHGSCSILFKKYKLDRDGIIENILNMI